MPLSDFLDDDDRSTLPPLGLVQRARLASGRFPLIFAAGLIFVSPCSDFLSRHVPADDLVGLNNRAVGLMGQFNYDEARAIFDGLAAAHPARLDVQVNLAIAT